MTAYISVRCDGCGSGYNETGGRHVSPQSLRQATRDVCPDCWKAGVR